jgi:Family of unknown function (DUF6266)
MKYQDNSIPFLFSGKLGNIVGRVINGKQFISKLPSPRKSKPSTRELEIRRNFTIAIQFLKNAVPVLKKYDGLAGKSGFNKAVSHLMRHAIQGTHPDQRINFSQVILGEGTLHNPRTYHVGSPAKGLLKFGWTYEMKRRISKSNTIFVLVYNEATHQFKYELSGPERRERQLLMDVSCFSGKQIEVWFGFSSASGALVSNSVYAGSINVL